MRDSVPNRRPFDMRVRFNARLVKLSKARGDDYIINLISATRPEEVQEFHAHMILRMHEMHPHGARGYFQRNTRMLLSRTTNILVNHQPHGHSSVAMLFYRQGSMSVSILVCESSTLLRTFSRRPVYLDENSHHSHLSESAHFGNKICHLILKRRS